MYLTFLRYTYSLTEKLEETHRMSGAVRLPIMLIKNSCVRIAVSYREVIITHIIYIGNARVLTKSAGTLTEKLKATLL